MSTEERLVSIRKKIAEKEAERKKLEEQEELTEQELLDAQAALTQELEDLRQENERAKLQSKVHQLQREGLTAMQIQTELQEDGFDAGALVAAQRILERSQEEEPRPKQPEIGSIDDLLGVGKEEKTPERGILYALQDQAMGGNLYNNASGDLYGRLQTVRSNVEKFGMTGNEYEALNAIQSELERQRDKDYQVGAAQDNDPQSAYVQRGISLINEIKQHGLSGQRDVYRRQGDDTL